VLPFGLLLDGDRVFQAQLLPWGLGLALLSSAIPYSLEMISLKAIPAKTFGILMSLEPAFAALSGFLLLSEKLTVFQWLAIVSIILASAGSSLSASRERSPAQEEVS
jgi:inner membrane transporter RhtA